MNVRFALLVVVASAQAAVTSGCFVSKCPDSTPPDGGTPTTNKDNCVEFTLPRIYEGNTVTQNATWSPGGTIIVSNANGWTKVSATGASGSGVVVNGKPFDAEPANDQGAAAAQNFINGMTKYAIGTDGAGTVTVTAGQNGRAVAGWNLTVTIPSDFNAVLDLRASNGDITVSPTGLATQVLAKTPLGDITVAGVAGSVTLSTDNGDVNISGLPAGGTAKTGMGDVTLALSAGANLTVKATASEAVNVTNAAWTVLVAAANSKTVTLGDYSKGTLELSSDFGQVTIGGG
jgi:hypothetical protein